MLRLVAAAILLSSCTAAQRVPAPPPPEGFVDPAAIRRHVEVLSADDFGGRAPGSREEEQTVRYLVDQMKRIGLSPGAGESYLQQVPLRALTVDSEATLVLEGDGATVSLRARQEAVFLNESGAPVFRLDAAPVVFVGFGIDAPAAGRDDFGDVDLTGKVALILAGATRQDQANAHLAEAARLPEKIAAASRRGAAAVILVLPPIPDDVWQAQVVEHGGTVTVLATGKRAPAPLVAVVRVEAAKQLVAAGGEELQALTTRAFRSGFAPVPLGVHASGEVRTDVREYVSHNVAGVLPGKSRPDEYVLFVTHWDGLGRCERDPATGDDLCNGAVDNASGVGGLLELARAFARAPRTDRSVLFLATTAEEAGLLGAYHYAANPLVPLAQTVGGMGMDTIAVRARGTDVVLLGQGLSELDSYVEAAAAAQGRALATNRALQQYFTRSDHFALAAAGIPMVIATGVFAENEEAPGLGAAAAERYMKERYHRSSDELTDETRFDGAAEDMELAYRFGKALANATDWPQWREGTPFRAVRAAQRPLPSAP